MVEAVYRKQLIPNYGVFDEARYFAAGNEPLVVDVAGVPVGVTVCEDLWGEGGPLPQTAGAGAQVALSVNASPYHRGKRADREAWASRHARESGLWVVYVNQVGGQDEIVFDGDSFVMTPDGEVVARGAQFREDLVVVDIPEGVAPAPARLEPPAEVYEALVLATGDYVRKNGFARALVGVSGGVDSALVTTIAADALGAESVTGVAMPSPHSSEGSVLDAKALCANLGVRYLELPIGGPMQAFAGSSGHGSWQSATPSPSPSVAGAGSYGHASSQSGVPSPSESMRQGSTHASVASSGQGSTQSGVPSPSPSGSSGSQGQASSQSPLPSPSESTAQGSAHTPVPPTGPAAASRRDSNATRLSSTASSARTAASSCCSACPRRPRTIRGSRTRCSCSATW